jgi:hypothetical protein
MPVPVNDNQDEKATPASAYVPVIGHEPSYAETVQLRYNYRLYPAPGQRSALARAFGCARVVFNDGLRARQDAHAAGLPYITDAELPAALTTAKGTPARAWPGEVSAVILQQSVADLNTAYRRFFGYRKALREWKAAGRKGPRPREAGLPRFKSRKDRRQAVRFTASSRFRVLPGGRLRLPKIGDVQVRWSRDLPSAPSSVTVIMDPAAKQEPTRSHARKQRDRRESPPLQGGVGVNSQTRPPRAERRRRGHRRGRRARALTLGWPYEHPGGVDGRGLRRARARSCFRGRRHRA